MVRYFRLSTSRLAAITLQRVCFLIAGLGPQLAVAQDVKQKFYFCYGADTALRKLVSSPVFVVEVSTIDPMDDVNKYRAYKKQYEAEVLVPNGVKVTGGATCSDKDTLADAQQLRNETRAMLCGYSALGASGCFDVPWQPKPYEPSVPVASSAPRASQAGTERARASSSSPFYGVCIAEQRLGENLKFHFSPMMGLASSAKGMASAEALAFNAFLEAKGFPKAASECLPFSPDRAVAEEVRTGTMAALRKIGQVVESGWKP
jgi:hypothetical protein